MGYIEVSHVSKSIQKREILKDINVTFEKGKVYGLYGHNGSGKTMLLRAVAGLIYPTKGTVKIAGQILGKDISFPARMGLLIENAGLWPYYTGFENLKRLASIQKKISDQEISACIQRVGLNPKDKRLYQKYSLGMKQRLGIAQAIMEKPDLILLDEPTNSLDDAGVTQIRTIIEEERKRGATILLASHIKEDLIQLCDQCFRLDDGRLFEEEIQW